MTLAEQLREEGIEQGKLEVAKQLLKDGAEPAFVSKITKLPLPKIKELKNCSP